MPPEWLQEDEVQKTSLSRADAAEKNEEGGAIHNTGVTSYTGMAENPGVLGDYAGAKNRNIECRQKRYCQYQD